jgi:cell division protein FtsN
MEQNKALLIILSVALFVAIVLGVGLWLFYPRADAPDTAEADTQAPALSDGSRFDPIEFVRTEDEPPELDVTESQEDDEEGVIIIYGEAPADEDRATGEDQATGEDMVEEDPSARRSQPPAEEALEPSQPAAPRATPTTERPAARPAARPAPEPRTREVTVTVYWIQVISSPSRDTVESAQRTLASQNLSGRITSVTVDGDIFYRLRVGPYESREEAGKFLDWISDIEGFGGSYISEVYDRRTVSGS